MCVCARTVMVTIDRASRLTKEKRYNVVSHAADQGKRYNAVSPLHPYSTGPVRVETTSQLMRRRGSGSSAIEKYGLRKTGSAAGATLYPKRKKARLRFFENRLYGLRKQARRLAPHSILSDG